MWYLIYENSKGCIWTNPLRVESPRHVQGMDEKITRDDKGRLYCNGKLLSDSAIDQRLRRWCTKKKHGGLKCSQEIYDRYHTQGHDARMELAQVFKDVLLNKDLPILLLQYAARKS